MSESGRLLNCRSGFRHAGLQRQRVQRAAHLAFERLVDDLVLLHPRFAAEGLGDDGRGIVVAVAGEVADGDVGVRNAGP